MFTFDIICILICLLLTTGIVFFPKKSCDWLVAHASLGSFGIRSIHRRNDQSDTLTHIVLFVCFILSFSYWLISDLRIVYVIYTLLFGMSSFLLIVESFRIASGFTLVKRRTFLFMISLLVFFAYLSAFGMMNAHQIMQDAPVFLKQVHQKKYLNILFYLQNHEFFSVFLQGVLFFASFYVVLAQYSYIRLENTFKANHIVLFCIKIIFVCFVLFILSFGVYQVMNLAYYIN